MSVGIRSTSAHPSRRSSTTAPGDQSDAYMAFAYGPDAAKKNADRSTSPKPMAVRFTTKTSSGDRLQCTHIEHEPTVMSQVHDGS